MIEASDVVLEVLDARDPLGCRCPQAEEAIVQSGQKKLVLVLNKSGEQKRCLLCSICTSEVWGKHVSSLIFIED